MTRQADPTKKQGLSLAFTRWAEPFEQIDDASTFPAAALTSGLRLSCPSRDLDPARLFGCARDIGLGET